MRNLFLLLLIISCFSSCFEIDNQFTALAPGYWRATLQVEPNTITPNPKGRPLAEKVNMVYNDVTLEELPFNFEVKYTDANHFYIELINGEERIKVDSIQWGHDKRTNRDTILIEFPEYDAYLRAIVQDNVMSGDWVIRSKKDFKIPFTARFGEDYRFSTIKTKPIMDISGKWEATFGLEGEEPYPAIGEFVQNGNYLTGTFLTETGDFRYLQGEILGNKLYLSCFDGAHAFLFEAKINPDSSIIGSFKSGNNPREIWEAKRNNNAKLANPESITLVKNDKGINFSFLNPEGKTISLQNPEYQGKVKIIQIMGTWCPNCHDETKFLVNYLKEKNPSNVSVIALAFERYDTPEKANNLINTYKKKMNMPYEMLYAGKAGKDEASKIFPNLSGISAFPTTIFVDKNNKIRKVFTGFNGPATSAYEADAKAFDSFVTALAAE